MIKIKDENGKVLYEVSDDATEPTPIQKEQSAKDAEPLPEENK